MQVEAISACARECFISGVSRALSILRYQFSMPTDTQLSDPSKSIRARPISGPKPLIVRGSHRGFMQDLLVIPTLAIWVVDPAMPTELSIVLNAAHNIPAILPLERPKRFQDRGKSFL